ncbi:MAG: acylglycerol kinase family protein, partial [Mobilitalea sp.]
MKELLFVFNPIAGRSKIKNYLFEIIDTFIKCGYSVNTYSTQEIGDATSVIANIDKHYDLIVCAGGDGTLNEVVSGLMRREESIPLGYIPLGSMNDVA